MTREELLSIITQDKSYITKHNDCSIDIQLNTKKLIYQYNNTPPDAKDERQEILKKIFGDENLNVIIEPPFHCDYGFNVHFEGFAFINYNCTILDTAPVYIGKDTFIAPGVCIACAGHGIHPDERSIYETADPIHIGKTVWIGANVTILPGVNIGDGSIIGAGSVVTKDIPANVIAAGNPCRVLREITDEDKINMKEEIKQL